MEKIESSRGNVGQEDWEKAKRRTYDELKPDFSEVCLGLREESQVDDEQYQYEDHIKAHEPLSYRQDI